MARLSVNVNKIATLRNARGENVPNVVKFAVECERLGAQGITVHPRPDERHITAADVEALSRVVTTEFNMEGYPDGRFMRLVEEYRPAQATLVPDAPGDLTSSAGWNVVENATFLSLVCRHLRSLGVRPSIFVDADPEQVRMAAVVGAERVELYTKPYADNYSQDRELAVAPFVEAASVAKEVGLGVNAGHDLNLENLRFFNERIPWLKEVSIGHAFVSDCLYLGLEATVRAYLGELKDFNI
ncbi:MAG: pyridoxine 5'-phosphate synthase [Muribaculaceae bacterium]|nr:pyridoxine 5'-phosphate synthase [Muribaculaceae bacterium]